MTQTFKHLVFIALLFVASIFNPVHAQTLVDSKMSGSWFDPTHNGEGFVVQVLESGKVAVYWFTYDEDGNQRWFFGTGTTLNDTTQFDTLLVSSGAVFGEQFVPEDIVYAEVGTLGIQWADCSTATASYTINGVAGVQSLQRLTTLAGLNCETSASAPSSMTGSWFDQTHKGEGLVIEILDDGRAVVFWFSYNDDGTQAWFYGLGEQNGTNIDIADMYITSGGNFGPDFDPQLVRNEPWGTLEVELGCDFGKFDYASELPAFGSGGQTLTRLTNVGTPDCEESDHPNILFVIADDLGLDASSQYDISAQQPSTPTLDQLASDGLVFENAWSNPTCSPSRAGILTGKYSTRNGVMAVMDVLSEDETSLQSYIHQHLPGKYVDAVIGKWHLGPQRGDLDHPSNLGISHFSGILGGAVNDYENWILTTDGQSSDETTYVTSKLVDLAIDWTGTQDKPWFLWLAFNAPHTPFHLPPADLHNRDLPGTEADIEADPLPYYFAAIEAMDTEIARLLDSLDAETRANTIVIFIGDNGTPGQVAQFPYSRHKAKGSLYQGGVNVPMFISGPSVSRINEREAALVNTTDLFSTIAALAGVNVEKVNDSISFESLLSEGNLSERFFQFSEQSNDSGEEWTISDGIYKLIESTDGELQLFELSIDAFEDTDLMRMGAAPTEVIDDLQYLADQIRQPSNGGTDN